MITLAKYFTTAIKLSLGAFAVSLLLLGVVYAADKARSRRSDKRELKYSYIKIFVSIWYLAFLLLVVFAGRPSTADGSVNFSLLASYRAAIIDFSPEKILNIVLNILLFVPFGYLASLAFKNKKGHWLVLLIGLLVAVFIEIIQYVLAIGILDVDDVINNFLGVVIGYSAQRLLLIFRGERKPGTILRASIYWLLLILPVFVFTGVCVKYAIQDYGNLQYESYYGHRLTNCSISFEEDSLKNIGAEIPIYRIMDGTTDDAICLAENIFCSLNTCIGEHVEQYDDCIVIYNEEHNMCLWYYYATATYRFDDFFRGAPDEADTDSATPEEVCKALANLGITVPEDSLFNSAEDGRCEFITEINDNNLETKAGSVSCVYYNGQAHMVDNHLLQLIRVAVLEKADREELLHKISRGDFYFDCDFKDALNNATTLSITGIDISYSIDTKGFYRPAYCLSANADGRTILLYIDA